MRYSNDQFHIRDPRNGAPPFIGHMAAYVDDLDYKMDEIRSRLDWSPYSVYRSISHTNPYLTQRGITFYKALYDTTSLLGFDVKLTQKVYN
jgi:hypothetical protein